MNQALVHPLYFGPIDVFVQLIKVQSIRFEINDNYQKQTYRTRQYIYGANGKLSLNVPIKHSGKNQRQLLKEIKLENEFRWQTLHWRSLETAYRTSPFFEYFEDDFYPIYHKKYTHLIDFTQAAWEVLMDSLGLDLQIEFTSSYQESYAENPKLMDLRFLAKAKRKPHLSLAKYLQVFESKNGYLENLSILDLLFNEGTNAKSYLLNQK